MARELRVSLFTWGFGARHSVCTSMGLMVEVLATSEGLEAKVAHLCGQPRLCDRAPIKSLEAEGPIRIPGCDTRHVCHHHCQEQLTLS